jgi:hypothetical protein
MPDAGDDIGLPLVCLLLKKINLQQVLSFIHEEEAWSTAVVEFLKAVFKERIDLFMSSDQSKIYAGEDWMARIFEELKAAKILISMLSEESVQRPWIKFEAGAAWMSETTHVIPVCFGGLQVGRLPKPYSNLQAIDIRSYSGMYYLVTSIAHYLTVDVPEEPFFTMARRHLLGDDGPG